MTHPDDPRDTAYEALCSVEQRDGYADRVLDSMLQSRAHPDARDRGLVTELVYGVLRRRGSLDSHLSRHLRRPLHRLDPEVLCILRLGAYQILYLDRVPDHAAVNVSVDMARRRVHAGAASLVNACLRSLCRERDRGAQKTSSPDSAAADVPDWLRALWSRDLGEFRARRLFTSVSRAPETWLRVNSLRTDTTTLVKQLGDEGIGAEASPDLPHAVRVRHGGDLRRTGAYRKGWFIQQDAASQAVVPLLAPEPGEFVLDLCAAPGVKTTQIAALMEGRGTIVAVDIHLPRLRELSGLCSRMGVAGVYPVCTDAGRGASSCLTKRLFDRVLVDAPCSGLGILRRNPERKWRDPPDIDGLKRLQARILRHAATQVRSGGVIVYSTCTVSRGENEQVVEAFLRERGDFVQEDPAPFLPARFAPCCSPKGHFCSWLANGESDFFFAARLRRTTTSPGPS